MTTHTLVFRPLALRQRAAFVNSWHKTALAVLDTLDDITSHHPEKGIETSTKGRFILNVSLTAHTQTFSCSVVYSRHRQVVGWEAFVWKPT